MPVYRGPDGKIIEEKTVKRQEDDKPTEVVNRPLPPAPQGGEATCPRRAVQGRRGGEDAFSGRAASR